MASAFHTMPLFKIVIPLVVGIALSKLNPYPSQYTTEFLLLIGLQLCILSIFLKHRKVVRSVCILFLFLTIGYLHHHFTGLTYQHKHFSLHHEATFLIISPENSKQVDNNVRSLCKVQYAGFSKDSIIETTGQMMVYFQGIELRDINPGDLILTNATFRKEEKNTNPEVFDYQAFLQNRGIYHRMYCFKSSYQLLSNEHIGIWNRSKRYQGICQDILSHHIKNENNLAVISAMVLGERNLLSDELYEAFTDTGSVHILAVSGLHVGIVAGIISFCLMFLSNANKYSRWSKVIISISGIWGFALLTGAAAAVTRAAIMFTLYFLAKSLRRKGISYNVLACAAFMMLLYNPAYLFQAGFQFSFLALIGIMFFYKRINNRIKSKYGIINKIWSLIALSLSAQLLVSPLAIFYFHKLPLYFWLTGIITVPFAGLILSAGLGLIGFDLLLGTNSIITQSLAAILEGMLSLFNSIIFQSQKLPFCSADNLWISETSILLIYSSMILGCIFIRHRKVIFLLAALGLLLIQSVVHNMENFIAKKEKEFVVYDIYSDSVCQIFYQGLLLHIDPGISSEKQVAYITNNNILSHRIDREIQPKELGTDIQEGFYGLDNYLFLFYPSESTLNFESKKPIDFLVLSADSYKNIKKLSSQFDIKQIVVDGTVKYNKSEIALAAYQLGIPIHFTTKHGAYEVML